jgi:HAE1 family hydrophobic/amphiphilic exporter-1
MMTSFAFVLGCVPLWIASGSGAVARQTLGTVVIGGMLGATCVDTLIVPVTFYIVETLGLRWSKKHPAPPPEAGKT